MMSATRLDSVAACHRAAATSLSAWRWEMASLRKWHHNGGRYQLVVSHFRTGIYAYLVRMWVLSYRLGMRPWICVAYSAPVAAASAVFLVHPFGQGSFSQGLPLGIGGTFNFMLVFQSGHDILIHPLHMAGAAGVFGDALCPAMQGPLIRDTTKNVSQAGHPTGQQKQSMKRCHR